MVNIGSPGDAFKNHHLPVKGVGLGRLASVIHPYPTQAEAIRQVGDMFNRTRLTPRVKRLFAAWLRWTR